MATQEELGDLKARQFDAAERLLTNVLIRRDRFLELADEYDFHASAYAEALVESIAEVNPEVGEAYEIEAQYYELSANYLIQTLTEIRRRHGME